MPPYYRPRVYLCLPVCVTGYMSPWVYTRVVYLSGVYQGGYTSQVCTREAIPRVYTGWYIPRMYNGWYIPSVYRVVVYTQGGGCGRYTQGSGCGRYTQGGREATLVYYPWYHGGHTTPGYTREAIHPWVHPTLLPLIHYEQAGYTPMQGAGC